MGGTSIKRKERKNRVKSKKRLEAVRRLTKRPVLKNIDIEAIKEDFTKNSKVEKSTGDKPPTNEEVKKLENIKVDKTNPEKSEGIADKDQKVVSVKSKKDSPKPKRTDKTPSSKVKNEKRKEKADEGSVE